jgi:two-component system, NtrC family, response regulator HydG
VRQKPLSILVVDDDRDNAQSLAELFELEGYDVLQAHSGEAAISVYLERNIDIAFMDVMLPGKNGVESFLDIRRLKPNANILMMSGYSVEQLMQQALDHGALGILSKPMDNSSILNAIADVGPKGVVVSEGGDDQSSEQLHGLLRNAGIKARILRESRSALMQPPNLDDGVLICDFRSSLIEGIGVCKEMRLRGAWQTSILIAGRKGKQMQDEPLLKDFSATGVINKPFDPNLILKHLSTL